ncbi:TolC family protein [Candidatus Methylospira mobilis]|nr:TolC family protein [Candidatus Methylospira mobilis]
MKSKIRVLLCCMSILTVTDADYVLASELQIDHVDNLQTAPSMSLRDVVEATFENHPQGSVITALHDEAAALHQRSDSLIAGYPMIYLQYIDGKPFNPSSSVYATYAQTAYQIPIWMWGQRDASQAMADTADKGALLFAGAIRHEMAGLVRTALWNLRLVENRRMLADEVYTVSEQLFTSVKRRVELGDLALSDQLLAESDLLEKQSLLTQAEAAVMDTRRSYINLTRLEKMPANFTEILSNRKEIVDIHPAVAAANAMIEKEQAHVDYQRTSKQGNQPTIALGTQEEKLAQLSGGWFHEMNVIVQIPIGGDDYNAPFVAQANLLLNQKLAERNQLLRQLEKALHEAEHTLAVDRKTLAIAEQRKQLAEKQIGMGRLAFENGEIQLIDYLKILTIAQAAIRDAHEKAILVERDIAFYNQVVGVTP